MNKRSYKQNCSLAFASDLLGERWTLLLFRELLIKPCRFKDLNQYLHGIGTNLLTNRLKELEQDGLIERQDPENKRSAYQLSQIGLEVEPIILSLIRWGYLYGQAQENNLHYDHWDLLAMKAFFNGRKGNKSVSMQFLSPTFTAWVRVSKKGFSHAFAIDHSTDILINSSIKEFQQALGNNEFSNHSHIAAFVEWFDLPDR